MNPRPQDGSPQTIPWNYGGRPCIFNPLSACLPTYQPTYLSSYLHACPSNNNKDLKCLSWIILIGLRLCYRHQRDLKQLLIYVGPKGVFVRLGLLGPGACKKVGTIEENVLHEHFVIL